MPGPGQNPPPNQQGPVQVVEDNMPKFKRAIEALSRRLILVGIPSDEDQPHRNEKGDAEQPEKRKPDPDREGGIQSNATLGYIHEHGAPSIGIPPRPWLYPGVYESQGKWMPYLYSAGQAAFNGDIATMENEFERAGMNAVLGVKNRITTPGVLQALSQRTIDARARRVRSRKARTEVDVTPLVDTSQLLNSIAFVVKR